MSQVAAKRSLVKQLSTVLSIWICGLWLATSVGVAWYINKEINEGFDEALVETSHRIIDLAEHELRDMGENSAAIQARKDNENLDSKSEASYLQYQVLTADNKVVLRSTDAPKQPMKKTLAVGFSNTSNLRLYTFRHPTEPLYIHVADSLSHRREAKNETLLWLLLPLLGILPLLMLIVRFTVARGLKPITEIASDIQRRSEQDLTPIATHLLPLELKVIASSTNQLFVRLKTALETERALAAQAAHELRTPLAAARMQLAGVVDSSADPHTSKGVQKAIESLKQLSLRTEKLLQMSRAQGGAALARKAIDLNHLAVQVLQTFWEDPEIANRLHLKVMTQDTATASVMGDHDTLAIALRNLIENALRHAPIGTVWVEVSHDRSISVMDTGAGVDEATLLRLRTGITQSPSDSAGHGLGLSIVKAIAQKHGAALELESPVEGSKKGFISRLAF